MWSAEHSAQWSGKSVNCTEARIGQTKTPEEAHLCHVLARSKVRAVGMGKPKRSRRKPHGFT
jgi:hypothetical protein